jgi:hypothetical protein
MRGFDVSTCAEHSRRESKIDSDLLEIPYDELELDKKIGRGSFGEKTQKTQTPDSDADHFQPSAVRLAPSPPPASFHLVACP